MDKEVLEILKVIQSDLSEVKSDLSEVKSDLNKVKADLKAMDGRVQRLENKIDVVVEQTADLLEFRTEMIDKVNGIREDLSAVELITANNYRYIVKLKAAK